MEKFRNYGNQKFNKFAKGPGSILKKVIDFVGILLVGWLVNNLPKIIKAIENFIKRVNLFVKSLQGFIGNLRKWLTGIKDVTIATLNNWKNFDFTDQSGKIKSAIDEMNKAYEGMEKDFDNMTNAVTEDIGNMASGDGDDKMDASSGAVSIDDKNARALLNAIAEAEGTSRYANQGYNTQYTGKQFSDLSQHPREILGDSSLRSDAAGRYQFLSTTWDSVMGGAMTPDRQDKAALKLVAGRNVNIKNGLSINEIYKLGGEWASIEGGPNMRKGGGYGGQAKYSAEQFMGLYKKYGGTPQSGDGNKKRSSNQTPAYQTAVSVGKLLNSHGFDVWQHPDFNVDRGYTGSGNERVMRRSYNSYHNYGEALDVPVLQRDGSGRLVNSPEKLDKLYNFLSANRSKFKIAELKWKDDANHFDHLHVSFKGSGNISSNINIANSTASELTPSKRRRKIIVIQEDSPSGGSGAAIESGGGSVIINNNISLNRFMKQHCLLDLAYT